MSLPADLYNHSAAVWQYFSPDDRLECRAALAIDFERASTYRVRIEERSCQQSKEDVLLSRLNELMALGMIPYSFVIALNLLFSDRRQHSVAKVSEQSISEAMAC